MQTNIAPPIFLQRPGYSNFAQFLEQTCLPRIKLAEIPQHDLQRSFSSSLRYFRLGRGRDL
jgi:hypothetical protein